MRTQLDTARLSLESLTEIEALVSEVVMQQPPSIRWQEPDGEFCFESLDEALDAARDPFMRGFLPDCCGNTIFDEIREFPPYATSLEEAWRVVEHLREFPFRLHRDRDEWSAAFGDRVEAFGHSPALAICLAALQLKGVYVDFHVVP